MDMASTNNLNRLKAVLFENERTRKLLTRMLYVNSPYVPKRCANKTQPDLYTLNKVVKMSDTGVKELLNDIPIIVN